MTATKNIQNSDNDKDQRLKELFGKEMSLKVPDGYFEELPTLILNSCKESDSKRIRPMYANVLFRRISAVAAILIMAAIVLIAVFTNRQPQADDLSEYSYAELYQLDFSNLAELEEAYLLSLVDDDVYNDLYNIKTDESDNITDEAIIEYLLAENHIEYLIINNY